MYVNYPKKFHVEGQKLPYLLGRKSILTADQVNVCQVPHQEQADSLQRQKYKEDVNRKENRQ
jgi:hypothetical protein